MNTEADEDDPFDVFGDDDSDEDDDTDDAEEPVADKKSIAVARSLMEAANDRIKIPKPSQIDQVSDSSDQQDSGKDNHLEDLSYLNEWENTWPAPMYKGDILLVSPLPVGGGRGYVATKPISPGTLVLVESPMMTWPEEQLGKKLGIISVKHLIEHPDASKLVHDLEDFYPTKEQVGDCQLQTSDGIDETSDEYQQVTKMIQNLQSEHSLPSTGEEIEDAQKEENARGVSELVQLAKKLGICSRDGSALAKIDIIRLLLALRYNGLESGVYRHVAMLNHDDYPNCAKFLPTNGKSFSEVRTTRRIEAGESLTISYLPRIVSHATRRKVLWEQHRFDIGVKHLKGERYQMEVIGNSLPPSPLVGVADDNLTDRIEKATEELERMHGEMEASFEASHETREMAKALEQTVLELSKESSEQLRNSNHILLIPILSLHVEVCSLVLKDTSLSNSNQLGVLCRQTESAHRLLSLQKSLLGNDHFDIARTSLDLADSISQLLSRSAKRLYEMGIPSLSNFAAWSSLEHKARQEHTRVKVMYPHDVEKHIKA